MTTPVDTRRTELTPPQLAQRWGVSPEKIIALILRGELKAFNVSLGRRPRWLIDEAAIADFKQRRAAVPRTPSRRRPRVEEEGEVYFK